MKRYLLFAGDNYYPSGGVNDFVMDYDTVEEAEAEAKKLYPSGHYCWKAENAEWACRYPYEWWQVVDYEDMKLFSGGSNR